MLRISSHRLLSWFSSTKKYALAHKVLSAIVLVVVLGGGWWVYGKATTASAETRYVLGTVSKGTIVSTVSASGQVSASRQLDIKPEVSGTITAINVKAGDTVKEGQILARINATDAQKALRDAQTNLETAQLTLQKLQQPASGLTLTQAQNAVSSAQDALTKAYSDTNEDIINVFLDLPNIMTGLQDVVIGTTASRGAQWNIDFYKNATVTYDEKAGAYRDDAYQTYIAAKASYDKAFADYKAMGNNPDNATIETLATETLAMLRNVSVAVKSSNSFIQFYKDTLNNHNQNAVSTAETALTNLSGYTSTTNSHLSSLSSDTTSIKTDKQNITEKTEALNELTDGPDELDVRSDKLTVQQRQDAVTDAQVALAKYTIRAPFNGTVSSIAQYVGDSAGSSALLTMVTPQQIATLSLNEVDVAKIKVGNKATLTFDAIDGLSLTGTVAQVATVGAVSQGVVSYEVQIAFDTQDERIRPGMTVNAAIQTATHADVLTVPSSAVKTQNGTSYVQVFNPALTETGGTTGVTSKVLPERVEVTTGISDDTSIEITAGLEEGQQIVTRTSSGVITTSAATGSTRTGGATNRTFGPGGGGAIRIP
jgi:RND family efflux transporter MFP subunit